MTEFSSDLGWTVGFSVIPGQNVWLKSGHLQKSTNFYVGNNKDELERKNTESEVEVIEVGTD